MKIGKMGLFATPESVKEIEDWIELHPKEERMAMYTVMGMTWNFLSEAVEVESKFGEKK